MRCLAFVVFLMLALYGCDRQRGSAMPATLADFNVVLVNVDTLRADHLGVYGYARPTSPFIDSLAREALVFEQARSNSSYTRESVAALMSGRWPSTGVATGWEASPPKDAPDAAELFRGQGYRTGFFSLTTMLDDPGFTRGFDVAEQLTKVWGLSQTGPKLTARALEFARDCRGQRFFLYLHYLDPHGPYDPPRDLYLKFRKIVFASPVDVYRDVRPHFQDFIQQGFGPGDERFEDMVVRYDAEIADTDRALAELVDGLGTIGVLDRTLIVLTADHGEEFLEHGFVEHAWTLYEESVHVPLIVWARGLRNPGQIDAAVSHVDVLPTLLALLEIPHPTVPVDGSVVLHNDGGRLRFAAPTRPYVGELLIQERNLVRAVTDEHWKYIAAQRWLGPSERPTAAEEQHLREEAVFLDPWGPVVREELYDLQSDPGERNNVIDSEPEHRAQLRRALDAVRTEAQARHSASQPAPLSGAARERLKALGYLADP
jgi:arylsulfatase